jgi:Protein of unknown function (DUF4038)/Domain of unknown function (DUF5060)
MTKMRLLVGAIFLLTACKENTQPVAVGQWTSHEIEFKAMNQYDNGYLEVDLDVLFTNDRGDSILRPAFWDGDSTWKVRFSPPDTGRLWSWHTFTSVDDAGLKNHSGKIRSVSYTGTNNLIRHGLLRMSPGKRNVIHADGTPFLVVGDTPWSIPYRATTSQVREYAADRNSKGFNTALLITVQPDKNAKGPEARNTPLGFDVAFSDFAEGHITKMKPDYFQTLDSIVSILIEHELTPLYAPTAHGYGWKGESTFGPNLEPTEYARYCRYLVARYGSTPAFWLVNLDGSGRKPSIKPGGEAIDKWDAYEQPTGMHYSPNDDWLATWANGDSTCCFHYNRVYQSDEWLDFQWAQTGHDGKHLYHKVQRMYDEKPTKANMVGESTYEAMGDGKLGLGWWQGEDAWNELMHGGTMGVVYGAACLWQWKVTADEPGWESWTNAPLSWRDAMNMEGSKYIGYVRKAFEGFDYVDMERRWDLTDDSNPLLAKEGIFYVSYLDKGGAITIKNMIEGLPFFWFDPRKGIFFKEGKTVSGGVFQAPDTQPWVLLIGDRKKQDLHR